MQEKTKCSHCGAQMKVWKHNLTIGLVRTLKKFGSEVLLQRNNDVNIHQIGFSTNEICNFQKLRYFGLVAKVKDAEGNKIAGHYLLTRRGASFLRGSESVRKWVSTFRNKIEERSEERVYVNHFWPKMEESERYFQSEFEYNLQRQMV